MLFRSRSAPTVAQQSLDAVAADREAHGMSQALRDLTLLTPVEEAHQGLDLVDGELGEEDDDLDLGSDGEKAVADERPQLADKGLVDGNSGLAAVRHAQREVARAVVVQHLQAHVHKGAFALEHRHDGRSNHSLVYFLGGTGFVVVYFLSLHCQILKLELTTFDGL